MATTKKKKTKKEDPEIKGEIIGEGEHILIVKTPEGILYLSKWENSQKVFTIPKHGKIAAKLMPKVKAIFAKDVWQKVYMFLGK